MKSVLKKMAICGMLFVLATPAQAGFFDFLFDDSEEEKPAAASTEQPAVVAAPASSPKTTTSAQPESSAMGLIGTFTDKLKVNEQQAQGGMGALMQFAQSNLSEGEFSNLSGGIPGMDTLLAAAPLLSGGSNSDMSGMLSNLGGAASALGGLDKLTKQFEALGLSSDMIAKFANLAVEYFSGQGGDTAALLQKGLGSLLG